MVNWKLGLRRSWIVATGCWVVGLPFYLVSSQILGKRFHGEPEFIFFMVSPPILLLLVLLSVVWATRGFVTE